MNVFESGGTSNIIWDFDGTLFDTYPAILKAFHTVLNEKHGLGVAERRMEDLVYISTKHCAEVLAGEYGMEYAALLNEVRKYYDQYAEEERAFAEAKNVLLITDGKRHFLVT